MARKKRIGKVLGEGVFGKGQDVKFTFKGEPVMVLKKYGERSQIFRPNKKFGIEHIETKDLKPLRRKNLKSKFRNFLS